jgi:hypothetical protein
MLKKRGFHLLIMAGVLVLVLPMGFDLKSSAVISLGFGSAFSLIRLNAKLVKSY